MNTINPELEWQACADKMEKLMEKLPEMEKLGALCAKLEQAAAVAGKAKELHGYEAEREMHLREIKKNRDAGNEGTAAYIENQMGYHLGLLRSAEKELKELLDKSGYASADEANRFISSNAPYDTLKARLNAFSAEYADTLEKLTALDKQLESDEE